MTIVHLSDIHVWRYTWDPRRLFGTRALGIVELLRGRARRFVLERLDEVVARAKSLNPDHVLITGDLTTTALPAEFADAKRELAPLLDPPGRVTVVPGNHDRYTGRAWTSRRFEREFGPFLPKETFPWLRWLDGETAILGLDPTRASVSPRGVLPASQLAEARGLLAESAAQLRRLIVACHYPVAAPPPYEAELAFKRLKNEGEVRAWLATFGPHLYCCGHVHAAWAFTPPALSNQLCLNAGAPLLADPTGFRRPGFLQIDLEATGVAVTHHAWTGSEWLAVPMVQNPRFFAGREADTGRDAAPMPSLGPLHETTLPARSDQP
jgi:3',5'-cyclic AMP phosphodiesterase CpdA